MKLISSTDYRGMLDDECTLWIRADDTLLKREMLCRLSQGPALFATSPCFSVFYPETAKPANGSLGKLKDMLGETLKNVLVGRLLC